MADPTKNLQTFCKKRAERLSSPIGIFQLRVVNIGEVNRAKMIFSYCQKCGLYITVPDEFAGGVGSCPRCKISLQIPTPLTSDSAYFVAELRYLASPAGTTIPDGLPAIATSALGPSLRYECPHWQEKYESLRAAGFRQGTCTKCGAVNMPVGAEVEFPRKFRTPEDGTKPMEMEGDFLLAQPSIDQTPSDSIIEGVVIPDEAEVEAEIINAAPGMSADGSQNMIPPSSTLPNLPNHAKWSYLLKGKPAGPVSADELMRLQQIGKINPSTPIWQHGMDGWLPIDNFPQLIYRPNDSKKTRETKPKLTPHQLSQYLLRHCQYIFWTFIVFVSFIVLLAVTRHTFEDLGPGALPTASTSAAFLILCMLIYGVVFVGVNSKRMKILPSVVRVQAIGGVLGLVWCLVVAFFFVFQPPPENKYEKTHTQWSVQRAKEVAHIFAKGDVVKSYKLVTWNKFQFNNEDIGKKYRETESHIEKKKIIAGVFLVLDKKMKPPPPNPTPKTKNETPEISPSGAMKDLKKTGKSAKKSVPKKPKIPRLINWRLVGSPSSQTVVEGVNSANKNKFVFTFNIGMLVQLQIKEHQKK